MEAYPSEGQTLAEKGFGFASSNTITPSIHESQHGALLLDGVIYNTSDLAAELGFYSASDVEVLNKLIERYGLLDALRRVNGDFSIIWIDHVNGYLWAARDPMGMRPLYYSSASDIGLVLSSQPAGLLKLESISQEIDREYLVRYGAMHYRMIDNEPTRSPYKNIQQCEPGRAVRFDRNGDKKIFQFWHTPDGIDFKDTADNLAEKYRALLLDSVKIRLKKYPKSIFTLSGGMDSSSILACAAQLDGKQIAYSSLYEDKTYDERDEIADMLPDNVSDWRRVILPDNVDIVSEVDKLIKIHDEPVATATWLSHRKLCESASNQGFNGIFGGLGGDELNAGEYEYFPMHFADLKFHGQDNKLEDEIKDWVTHHNHPIYIKTNEVAHKMIRDFADSSQSGKCIPDLARLTKYLHTLSDDFAALRSLRPRMETVFSSYLKSRTWQDLTRETIPCCIRAEDRHGAFYGLPPVLPFLDKRLIEFMYKIPGAMKIKGGVTKILLRQAMQGILPEATRTRVKKTGWNAPSHIWFTSKGANDLRDLVNSDSFRDLGLYKKNSVIGIIDEHESIVKSKLPKENHMMFLWSLLNVIRWNEHLMQRKNK